MKLLNCPFCNAKVALNILEDEPGQIICAWIKCLCGAEISECPTEERAVERWNTRAPAQEPVTTEPVAWTNEAQLGFLKEPGYRVVPMAMWAFQHSAHPIALYTIPAPPQREEIAEHLYTKFGSDPSIEWQDAPEKLKDVWRRYAGEIASLSS